MPSGLQLGRKIWYTESRNGLGGKTNETSLSPYPRPFPALGDVRLLVGHGAAGLHELAHALTIDELCGEAGWVFEGVAMHCSEWWISYEDYEVFFDLAEDIDTMEGASEDERFIFGEIRRIFKELSGVDVSEAQTLESPAIPLVKAMTCAMLLHPERDVFIKMVSKPSADVVSSFYKPRYPATVLSHAKSYAFCEYLLDQGRLTLDQLVAASLDLEGYRAAFPTDEYFDELYAEYLNWLREEYGS